MAWPPPGYCRLHLQRRPPPEGAGRRRGAHFFPTAHRALQSHRPDMTHCHLCGPYALRDDKKWGSPYKSMQVYFYQRVTGIGITNKNLQVNAS